jgi:methyl-accepting chemotaxis protein
MLYNTGSARRVQALAVLPVVATIILLMLAVGSGLGLDLAQTFSSAPAADSDDAAALVRLGDAERSLRLKLAAAVATGDADVALRRADDVVEALALSAQYHERVLAEQRRLDGGLRTLQRLAFVMGLLAIIAGVCYGRRVRARLIEPIELLGHVMSVVRIDGAFSRRAPEFGHPAIAQTVREFNALMEQLHVNSAAATGAQAAAPDPISTAQTLINPDAVAQLRAEVRAASGLNTPAGCI